MDTANRNGEPLDQPILKPHVHLMISSVGRVRGLEPGSEQKPDRFVKLRRDELYSIRNWWKREIENGMISVPDEQAFANEFRLAEQAQKRRIEWDRYKEIMEKDRRIKTVTKPLEHVARLLEGDKRESKSMWRAYLDRKGREGEGLASDRERDDGWGR